MAISNKMKSQILIHEYKFHDVLHQLTQGAAKIPVNGYVGIAIDFEANTACDSLHAFGPNYNLFKPSEESFFRQVFRSIIDTKKRD